MLAIRLYWLVPARKRKQCLFKESCSRYVYRITRNHGFVKGFKALLMRWRQCRPGYHFIITAEGTQLVCRDHSVIAANETVFDKPLLVAE